MVDKKWKCQMNEMARYDGKLVRINCALINKPIYLGKGSTDFSKIRDLEEKKKWMIVQRSLHAKLPQGTGSDWKILPSMSSKIRMHQAALQGELPCDSKYNEYSNKIGEQTHVKHALN